MERRIVDYLGSLQHCPERHDPAKGFRRCPQQSLAPSALRPHRPCLDVRRSTACLRPWVQFVPEVSRLPPSSSGCPCPWLRGAANPSSDLTQWVSGTKPYTNHCTLRKESQAADLKEKTCCPLFLLSFSPFLCFTVCLCLSLRCLQVIFTSCLPFSHSSLCCSGLLLLFLQSLRCALCSVLCVCVQCCVSSLNSITRWGWTECAALSLVPSFLSLSLTDYSGSHVTKLWLSIGYSQFADPTHSGGVSNYPSPQAFCFAPRFFSSQPFFSPSGSVSW